jgi:predicted naringenin-chalcone synthase
MSLAIVGLGTALPADAMPQTELADAARMLMCRTDEQRRMLPRLFDHTGIRSRHMALGPGLIRDIRLGTRDSGSPFLPSGQADDLGPGTSERMRYYAEKALPLAVQAATQALEHARWQAGAITHLVTVSCTGFAAPGVDIGLIQRLGLSPSVQRVHVGFMGCHGAINGLRVAQAFSDALPAARILLCAVELCSLHLHYQFDPKRNVANALFADGAAAIAGTPGTLTNRADWRVAATGSCLIPGTQSAMRWHIGDHGFDMMLSTKIPSIIAGALRPWLESWLAEHGLKLSEVKSWAVHPGGPKVLEAVGDCLNLPHDALADSQAVLTACGNMSSPTVLFILDRLRRRDAPRPCVMLGFGPGMVAEAALLT